ncbi:unnamed protein product [Toxocara canis]|uniref:tRNA (adenine(58)-N(1))-methyltransferase catalytic subunit TRMT61A n=1 Tax=Toxocara canis TaxID=6265 RepID=A0A183U4A1_TOXCA|nr:unnamed protein product [Toxocara canis]
MYSRLYYGSRVSATAGYVYALRPSAALWTRTLPRRTQILYTPDCALILLLLDAKPGSVLCESGTGSGSLSHALAMAISPTGHLYTHDIEEPRVKQVEEELKKHGLGEVTTCVHQNVCEDGFFVENACDGVFLDLPAPWTAISHAKRALSRTRGGRIVSFSPCVEQVFPLLTFYRCTSDFHSFSTECLNRIPIPQVFAHHCVSSKFHCCSCLSLSSGFVQRVCDMLRRQGFVQIETVELVSRKLKVNKSFIYFSFCFLFCL